MKHLEKLPLGLLTLFTIKLMILNTWSYEAAIVLLGLATVTSVFHYIASNDQLKQINNKLAEHSKQFEDAKKDLENLKTHVSGIKLASQMKPQQPMMKF